SGSISGFGADDTISLAGDWVLSNLTNPTSTTTDLTSDHTMYTTPSTSPARSHKAISPSPRGRRRRRSSSPSSPLTKSIFYLRASTYWGPLGGEPQHKVPNREVLDCSSLPARRKTGRAQSHA